MTKALRQHWTKAENTSTKKKISFLTPGRILFLLVLGALAIRAVAALTRPMIQLDETAYVRMAENLAGGHGLLDISGSTSTHFSPLPSFFIAGLAVLARNYILAAYIIVTVFGSLILIPTYLLGRELSGQRVGLLAAALMAVTPLFVDYSSRIYSESLYIFFLGMALVLGLRMIRGGGLLNGTLTGVSLGFAYLSDPEAVYYVVVFAGLAIMVGLVRHSWSQLGKSLLLFVLLFLTIAAPYIIFLHSQLGKWTYSGKISQGNFYAATHNLRFNTLDWEKDQLQISSNGHIRLYDLQNQGDPLTIFFRYPVLSAKIFARQTYKFYSQVLGNIIPLWLLPLLGLGLFAGAWTRRRAAGVGYLLLMMAPALLILAMYAHDRFFMPFVPLIMIWVAEGWKRIEEWGRKTIALNFGQRSQPFLQRWAPWIIGVIVLLPLLLFSAVTVVKQSYPVGYKDAGEYIKQTTGGGKRILSREYSAAYYSGGTAYLLPYDSYDKTTAYARYQHIDYLVISKEELADWRPTLARLLQSPSQHPEWKLVDRVRPGTSQETLIFQLQPA